MIHKNNTMTVTIIGLGLIGGSMALALKEQKLAHRIIGVDNNPQHVEQALQLGLINDALPLKEAIRESNFIYVAIPVNAALQVIPEVLNEMNNSQTIADAGSTKQALVEAVKNHPLRSRFVATHPMWGTEFSGPQAAVRKAFKEKVCVICNKEESHPEALNTVQNIYESLQMKVVYMNAYEHDIHAAYVSHISHITSFALANTVLEKEKEEEAIFELASAGFESTVRLAKSNADMWVPIFMQNKENVLDVLNEHISQLRKFKASLEKENETYLRELIDNANKIKKII